MELQGFLTEDLHDLLESVGYKIRVFIEREDGQNIDTMDEVTIRSIVESFSEDERQQAN